MALTLKLARYMWFEFVCVLIQQVVYTFMGHTGGVSSLGVGDKTIISSSDDHTCRIWDLRTPTLALTTLLGHSRTLYAACAATDTVAFTGGMQGFVHVIQSDLIRCR